MELPRLLLADDDRNILVMFSLFLKSEFFSIETVSNGRDAVDSVERHVPAVILMDMDMPVMDGYDATRAIRALHAAGVLPIIGLTGHHGPDAEAKCLDAGCTSYLAKPVMKAALIEAVGSALRAGAQVASVQPAAFKVPPELAARFIQERVEDLKRASTLVATTNFMELAKIGHQIKGSSAILGFPRIGAAGAALEEAALKGQLQDIELTLRTLETEVKTAESFTSPPP